jgi:hypothetical protein
MWTWPSDSPDKQTIRFLVRSGDRRLSWDEVLSLWRGNPAFRTAFSKVLAAAPFEAFRWETPAVTAADRQTAFEFVLVDSPELLTAADPSPFAGHFRRAGSAPVVAFQNLGSDAELLVPCPLAPQAVYTQLAAFVRAAPDAQQQALWREVSLAMERRLDDQPVWLSTAGGGVAWLHVRLDDRPKYYVHRPYRSYPRGAAAAAPSMPDSNSR